MNIKRVFYRLLVYLLRAFSIKKNKILFCSYHGNSYSGNPRYIAEALLKKNKNLDIVWLTSKELPLPEGMRSVKGHSIAALFEYVTAKVWIDDCRKPVWLEKRKGQYYIQTWHASIGLKKAEGFAVDTLPVDYLKSAEHDSKMADLFLSDSTWLTTVYQQAFWYDGKILERGLPREDMLYMNHEPFRKKLIEEYNFTEDTYFVLYAPTFRNSGDMSCYNIDYEHLIETLEKSTNLKWKIIVRLHPNLQSKQGSIQYNKKIINGSKYNDINTLILGSNLVISDYSSCVFDATIAKVPVLIYATDIDKFSSTERGLFFSWDELPFKITQNNEELNSAILTIFDDNYIAKAQQFLKKCGFIKNEHSSDEVALIVMDIINR